MKRILSLALPCILALTLTASAADHSSKPRIGGGVDDDRMFDKVMEPVIQQLAASLKAADL